MCAHSQSEELLGLRRTGPDCTLPDAIGRLEPVSVTGLNIGPSY